MSEPLSKPMLAARLLRCLLALRTARQFIASRVYHGAELEAAAKVLNKIDEALNKEDV